MRLCHYSHCCKIIICFGKKKWIFLWSWIVWQLEDIVCYIWPDFYGWDLLSVFSWHDYWSYCCSSISYHLSYVNWPSLHKSWFVACLQFALLCCAVWPCHTYMQPLFQTQVDTCFCSFLKHPKSMFSTILFFFNWQKERKPHYIACLSNSVEKQ